MIAPARRRGACPALTAPMQTGDGLLVRLNPVAGGLSPEALTGLCRAAERHGNGIVEITARGSIQIRGLTPSTAVKLADDVNTLGIAVRTGVPVETGPLAGLDPDEVADPRPLADAIRATIERAGLSRRLGPKVSVIVDGGGRFVLNDVLADVRLMAVRQDREVLWHLAVGGTARTARTAGLLKEVDACAETVSILSDIADLGRTARARDLPSPLWGGSYGEAGRGGGAYSRAIRTPTPALRADPPHKGEGKVRAALGIFSLFDSTHALAIALPFGSMRAKQIEQFAEAAAELGCAELRPALGRILLAIGLSADTCARLQEAAAGLGFVTDPADPRLAIAACPGAPACASGMTGTRPVSERIAKQAGDLLDGSFTLHVSGCAKGCAHPAPATLTLVGGENGAGLVVNGTAKTLPSGYASDYEAALGRVVGLVRAERRRNETGEACLARLGTSRVAAAFEQE